jgi:hypothetical protein
MFHVFDDLSGRTFGRLLVLDFDHFDRHYSSYYKVRCICGTEKVVQRSNLISGSTVSCSCHRLEQAAMRRGDKSPTYKHGHATRENAATYEKWAWANRIRKGADHGVSQEYKEKNLSR